MKPLKRLTDSDVGERAMQLRLGLLAGIPLWIMLFVIEFLLTDLFARGFVVLSIVMLLNVVAAWLITCGVWHLVNSSGQRTIARLWAGGGAPSLRGYSEQESLVIRGEIEKAVSSYRDRIASNPADLNARLRLGSLLASQGDHTEAEHWFLQVRIVGASAEQEAVLSNSLIDLYRANGDRPKLKSELTRFARHNAASEAGQRAQELLRELTREDADADHVAER